MIKKFSSKHKFNAPSAVFRSIKYIEMQIDKQR